MTTWVLTCTNCGTGNKVLKDFVIIKCGIVSCRCSCSHCKQEVLGQQSYWQWLGLTEELPVESDLELP